MRTWWRMGAWIGAAFGLAACAAEADIGADACPRGAKCEVRSVPVSAEVGVDVHTTGVALDPVWKTSELHTEAAEARPIGDNVTIATAPNGGLWLFTYTQTQLEVMLLDADANVLGERAVAPPSSLKVTHRLPLHNYGRAVSHPGGPVIDVSWGVPCEGSVPREEAELCTTSFPEVLAFGDTLDDEPVRIFPFGPKYAYNHVHAVQRSRDAEAIFVLDMRYELSMLDLRGNALWRRDLSHDRFGKLPYSSNYETFVVPSPAALSPDGSVSFGVMLYEREGRQRTFPGGLVSIGNDGEMALRLYQGPIAGLPIHEASGYTSSMGLAFDADGDTFAVHALAGGDVLVLRLSDDRSETYRLLREDYADLWVQDVALDPAGTLFISVQGGGRNSPESLLCRLHERDDPTCFSPGSRIFEIEAPSVDVVFGVSPGELARFDFE